ncbi:MAG: polysaccharide biosynthesis/export family protein, partial [Bacteroidaceae bacterium]|nr:polysaccharide biosynthesis/export family protein [Bacteroidaceae bacterium]
MIKKIFFIVALSFSFQWVTAQTVSDEQVVKMIMTEKERGATETEIARKLLQSGATPAQIRRIKGKYEQEQKGLGAVDLTGKEEKDKSRLRTDKNKNESEKEPKGNFVVSKEEEKTKKQQEEEIQKNMAFLDLDSVVHYKEMLKEPIGVFGRNLFNNELLTFEPAMNIPVPADYVLGAGDQVIIDVWGASQMTFDNVISPDGFIVVEGAGRVKLSGLTVADADKFVNKILGEYYNGSSISLTVGETRNVKVDIVGEVVTPGSYTISAFSTLFNALYMAGGISELGTLREINVYRNGKSVSKIDVYDYII